MKWIYLGLVGLTVASFVAGFTLNKPSADDRLGRDIFYTIGIVLIISTGLIGVVHLFVKAFDG